MTGAARRPAVPSPVVARPPLAPGALDELGTDLVARLSAVSPAAGSAERVVRGAPAAPLTTYRVGGPIGVLVRVGSAEELEALAEVVRRHRPPLVVLGRGSNLLVADAGFPGLGVILDGGYADLATDGPDGAVRAGGGVPLPVLARRSAAAGRGGLEFYVGIPGTVGGAVRMNAGGHGRETRDVVRRAWVADLEGDGVPRAVGASELGLGYRTSRVAATEVVVAAEMATEPCRPGTCEARIAEIVRWRRDHQPGGANAGSVFRNPPGDSAGRLVDACGLKGLRRGRAYVSPKHGNFIQADAGATAADVVAVVGAVRRRVADATGVVLEPELRLIGFDAGHGGPARDEGDGAAGGRVARGGGPDEGAA